ncbi:DUF6600 domain-containing protein [Pedobacter aquatilis]|uniref:DUF6600 domain-containing protein n=1 Tax=Pedobacter aquatilis TaxID=351343 RepID=UPI00292CD13A|nr:DUF6600 domain-containing protein [Pedobacter aquatilis]
MKTLKTTALVLGLFALLAGTTTLARAQGYEENYQSDGYNTGNVSMQTFYDELSPYGTWIQDPQYGYVWRPDVDQDDFRPYYTNGRWVMTEYGNTWVSNYDWGWAPFHYGRWVFNNYRQWIWLPDTNWGPAWVDWRSGDGYYGWAPMAPAISINLSFGRRYAVPDFCWNFIPQTNIYINRFPRYDYGRNNVYIRNTTIINNTYVYNRRSYYGGPRMEDIRRATNRDVRVYRFEQSNRPGAGRINDRAVSIYRPRPERGSVDNRSAAPRKFEQGNAGFNRNGRGDSGYANRDQNGSRNDNRMTQPNRRNDGNLENRRENQSDNNRGGVYNRDANRGADRANQNLGEAEQRNRQTLERSREQGSRDQERIQQMQQRSQQERVSGNQQAEQQRQQMDQQRAQRSEQMQQQRQQQQERSQQMQQQRSQQAEQQRQQMDQQRAQRSEQLQQQRQQQQERSQQMQQQRNEQMQQQRQQRIERPAETRQQAPPQQQNRSGGERSSEGGGRPTRGGRG